MTITRAEAKIQVKLWLECAGSSAHSSQIFVDVKALAQEPYAIKPVGDPSISIGPDASDNADE